MLKHLPFLNSYPKKIFLLDGIGAIMTAICLFSMEFVLNLELGMPKIWMRTLIVIAICLSIYSFSSYFITKENWTSILKILSIANLSYCLLTFSLIIVHFKGLSLIAMVYFPLEIIAILILVALEIHVLKIDFGFWRM